MIERFTRILPLLTDDLYIPSGYIIEKFDEYKDFISIECNINIYSENM